MSATDRTKWNRRYREGSYEHRVHPSPFLTEWLPKLSLENRASVIDIACGSGRNALYLVRQGFDVEACDISDIALARLNKEDTGNAGSLLTRQVDFDDYVPEKRQWDLVIMFRYFNRRLQKHLASLVKPNGYLVVEQHLSSSLPVGGPQPPTSHDFRLRPNELHDGCSALHTMHYEEGVFEDPDGISMSLARIVACQSVAIT